MPANARHRSGGTSHQIRRAYQKYGPRVSEAELRRARRSHELLQRAERIHKAEQQKKTNQQKRGEKAQRDQEIRKRMGIPEPKIGYIGPSQIRMSQFCVRNGRREGGTTGTEVEEAEAVEATTDTSNDDTSDTLFDQLIADRCEENHRAKNDNRLGDLDTVEQQSSLQKIYTALELDALAKKEERLISTTAVPEESLSKLNATREEQANNDTSKQLPGNQNNNEVAAITHLSQAELIVRIDEPWDAETETPEDWSIFLASNSQIERELSLIDDNELSRSQTSLALSSLSDLDSTDEELNEIPSLSMSENRETNLDGLGEYIEFAREKHHVHKSNNVDKDTSTGQENTRRPEQDAINDPRSDFDDSELDNILQQCLTPTIRVQQRDQEVRPPALACSKTRVSPCYTIPEEAVVDIEDFLMSTQELREIES